MRHLTNTSRDTFGFSLAEVLAVLTIGAMILVTVLGIYSRAESSAAAITQNLDSRRLPFEVLQRITEDIDSMMSSASDVRITINNKLDNLYQSAQLKMRKTVYDSKNKPQTYEEIIWQSGYDYDGEVGGLVLYRSHSGLTMEEKLLDKQKESWERELFVPVCRGVSLFKVQIPRGERMQDQWTSSSVPMAVVVTISFAEPYKSPAGTFYVPDAGKTARTIAINKTRKMRFVIIKKVEQPGEDPRIRMKKYERQPTQP